MSGGFVALAVLSLAQTSPRDRAAALVFCGAYGRLHHRDYN